MGVDRSNPRAQARRLIVMLLALLILAGCTAVRSESITALADRERTGVARVAQRLQELVPTIDAAGNDLKTAQQLYLRNLALWDRELKRAQIFAASPGDLQNVLVRQAVMIQLGQLEMDRADDYAGMRADFETQVIALVKAYQAITAAAAKVAASQETVRAYVHSSWLEFGARSIDLQTIEAALVELEGGRQLLQQAASAGEAVDTALKYARALDRDQHLRDATEILSLIANRLKELKQ